MGGCGSGGSCQDKLIQRTYPVADLIIFGDDPSCQDELIKNIEQIIAPMSWQEHGGCGTIDYYPLGMALVANQTAEVHECLNAYLTALRRFSEKQEQMAKAPCCKAAPCCVQTCAATTACACDQCKKGEACSCPRCKGCDSCSCGKAKTACACDQCKKGEACSCPSCKGCDSCCCGKARAVAAACACDQCKKGEACSCPNCKGCDSCCCGKAKACASCAKCQAVRTQPRQYGHFVMDNVTINAMGVSARIKRIRVMYKGDGIECDLAKCAGSDSEKKVDGDKVQELIEKLGEILQKKDTPCGMTLPSPRYLEHPPQLVPMVGVATGATMSVVAPVPAPCASMLTPTCPVPVSSAPTCSPSSPAATTAPVQPKPAATESEVEDD
jgi:hypothetical protein